MKKKVSEQNLKQTNFYRETYKKFQKFTKKELISYLIRTLDLSTDILLTAESRGNK